MLLGHVDTVVSHAQHARPRVEADRIHGAGTVDMKGGVALALGVARALANRQERFAELALLLVTDEEWRTAAFAHVPRFADYDACLCFEAGEITDEGDERVIVRRKAASTLRLRATGRSAHSGSAPHEGANALVALARASLALSECADPKGAARLTVVPTIMRAGDAINVVPAAGELVFDLRATGLDAFDAVLGAVPPSLDGVTIDAQLERIWPGMDSEAQTAGVLAQASARIGRRIVAGARGGASDASHFAAGIPLTIDGLGPRGDGAHTPGEFVLRSSLRERTEVALAVALTILER
jgi:glutamate carboxypeptidase